jgi:hypothetical protein
MFGRDDQHAVGLRDLVLKAHHFGRQLGSLSWLYIGKSSMRANVASNLPAPSRTSATASLRLIESRRLLPTITAMRGKIA